MKITQNLPDKNQSSSFDINGMDYDMFVIVLEGFKRKYKYVSQRKAFLKALRFETIDMNVRQDIFSQVKYLESLEKRLNTAIMRMEALFDY